MRHSIDDILAAELGFELGWVDSGPDPSDPNNKRRVWKGTPPDKGTRKQISKPGSGRARKKPTEKQKGESAPAADAEGPSLVELYFERLVQHKGRPGTTEGLAALREQAEKEMALFEKAIPRTGWGEAKLLKKGPFAPSKGWKGENLLRKRLEDLQKLGLVVVAHDAGWNQYVARAGTPIPDWLSTQWDERPKGYRPVPEGDDPFTPRPPKRAGKYSRPELKELARAVRSHPSQLKREKRAAALAEAARKLSSAPGFDFHGLPARVTHWPDSLASDRFPADFAGNADPERVREYMGHSREAAGQVDQALDFFEKHLGEEDPEKFLRAVRLDGAGNGYIQMAAEWFLTRRFNIPVEENGRNWRVRDHGYPTVQDLLSGKVTIEQARQHDLAYKQRQKADYEAREDTYRKQQQAIASVLAEIPGEPSWVKLGNALRKKYPGVKLESKSDGKYHNYYITLPEFGGFRVYGEGQGAAAAFADLLKKLGRAKPAADLGFTLATPDPAPPARTTAEVEADVEQVLAAVAKEQTALSRAIQKDVREALEGAESLPGMLAAVRDAIQKHRPALVKILAGARAAAGLVAMARLAEAVPPAAEVKPAEIAVAQPPAGQPDRTLPLVREAAARLQSRRLLLPPEVQGRLDRAQKEAEEDARSQAEKTQQALQDGMVEALVEGRSLRDYKGKIREVLRDQSFLSDRHLETVFRSNVMEAYSAGQMELVQGDPQVAALYPYAAYHATHDDRVREQHLAMETLGLDGTNVYRADDPVLRQFRPPWSWNCRCSLVYITVEQAAKKGVREAQRWLETGRPPAVPEHVPAPAFGPDETYHRELALADIAGLLGVELGWEDSGPDPADPRGRRRVWKGTPPDSGTRKQIRKPGTGRAPSAPEQPDASRPAAAAPPEQAQTPTQTPDQERPPAAQPGTYGAVVLDEDSRGRLLEALGERIPPGWRVLAHHMTTAYGRELDAALEGKRGNLRAVAVGFDPALQVLAVKVESDIPSENATPHVTVAVGPRGKPKDSNRIADWEPLEPPLEVRGTAQTVRPQTVRPQPGEAAASRPDGDVQNVPTGDLSVDPVRFQYKLNTNAAGVTDEMSQVKTWNPDFAGVISVWRDPANGKTYVVNGHHRYELARRLGVGRLAVRHVKAATAKEARAIGALVNIAEGRGTAVDAAKFLRDSGLTVDDLAGKGVSLKGKVAADAAVLVRLNDRLFDRVARGLMDEQQALAVARHLDDPALQDQLVSLLEKREEDGRETPTKVVEEMAREMASTPTATRTERGLFGDIESTESLFVPRNELKAHIRSELAREVNDFAAVASKRRAARVAGAGNTLDVDRNKEIAEQTGRAKNAFDQLVNRKGEISDALNRAAADYAGAKTKRERENARAAAYAAVRRAVFAEAGLAESGIAEPGPGGGVGTQPAGEGPGSGAGGGTPQGATAGPGAGQPGRGIPQPAGLTNPVAERWYHDNPTLDDAADPVQRRKAVERAVAGGVKVPPEVLEQHPGITPESAQKAVREDRVADALKRYDDRGSLRGERGSLFGGDDLRSRERFHQLPSGTEVVITDGAHRGRTGKLIREKSLDGSERVTLQLDGETATIPVAHDAVEPLDDRLSWRTVYGSGPRRQEGLFGRREMGTAFDQNFDRESVLIELASLLGVELAWTVDQRYRPRSPNRKGWVQLVDGGRKVQVPPDKAQQMLSGKAPAQKPVKKGRKKAPEEEKNPQGQKASEEGALQQQAAQEESPQQKAQKQAAQDMFRIVGAIMEDPAKLTDKELSWFFNIVDSNPPEKLEKYGRTIGKDLREGRVKSLLERTGGKYKAFQKKRELEKNVKAVKELLESDHGGGKELARQVAGLSRQVAKVGEQEKQIVDKWEGIQKYVKEKGGKITQQERQQIQAFRESATAQKANIAKFRSDVREHIVGLIGFKGGKKGGMRAKVSGNCPKELTNTAGEVLQWFNRFTDSKVMPQIVWQEGVRCFYDPATDRVHMGRVDAAILAHEITHAIEHHDPEVMKATQAFIEYRCDGEIPHDMKEFGMPGEMGRKDKFDAVFGPGASAYYAGKVYKSGHTEVLTKGIEALYNDPIGLAEKDPEYFAFIVGVLKGTFRLPKKDDPKKEAPK